VTSPWLRIKDAIQSVSNQFNISWGSDKDTVSGIITDRKNKNTQRKTIQVPVHTP
jgi:hypothetical protein